MSAPLDVRLPRSWDTAAAGIAAAARALGDGREVGALQAASGLAFRISIDERVTPAGPHDHPWRETLTVAAERLGCTWRLVASTAGEPLFAAMQHEALALAVAGIEAGRPTLLFGVHLGEFGLVRGRGAGDELIVSGLLDDAGAPSALRGERLGQEGGILFALQLVARLPVDESEAARAGLEAAAAHARLGAPAWRRWQAALSSGDVDPTGLAACAQRYAESRALAAAWLPVAGAATGLDLEGPARGWRRTASMLAELARLWPFPPGPTAMLTSTLREEALGLVEEAARAETEASAVLADLLARDRHARATARLTVRDLDEGNLRQLFACTAEIPIAGLDEEAAACRADIAPRLGERFFGRLLFDGEVLAGHLLWSPLAHAAAPVVADGDRWFAFCPWLAQAHRGQGLGAPLFAALDEAARAAGVDGVLTLATSIDVFVHHHHFERYGFVEVDRRGDTRLLEKRFSEAPSRARFAEPHPATVAPLVVAVRYSWSCPLLLRAQRDAAQVARTLGLPVDEAPAGPHQPAGITVAGRPLPHGPLPPEHLLHGLKSLLPR